MRIELLRYKKRSKIDQSGTSVTRVSGTQSAMEREVASMTKKGLWKICKFIKNEVKLNKAVKFVMEKMDLADFDGLDGEALVSAQEEWKSLHSKFVRTSLNKQRNYVQQVSFGAGSVT